MVKISDPIRYFEDKPSNVKDIFMIYPLEAIGYEDSVKSPYLDMLNDFRSSLRVASVIFIVSYSLRDPIIGSIFEEVVAERIRKGDINPLSENFDSRKSEVSEQRFKIIVLNPEPDKLVENLRKQFSNNLLQTFVPIRIEFPRVADENFALKYSQTLLELITNLVHMRYIATDVARNLANTIRSRYDIPISEEMFEWYRPHQ